MARALTLFFKLGMTEEIMFERVQRPLCQCYYFLMENYRVRNFYINYGGTGFW